LNTLFSNYTETALTFGKSFVCERLNKVGKSVGVVTALLMFHIVMLLSGSLEDVSSVKAFLSDGFVIEPLLLTIIDFLAYPIVSTQLLIGLFWLLFHVSPVRRAGIILRKAAFAFSKTKVNQLVHAAHGCRAPPRVISCL